MDGYHKLIRWRLVIHGCIDGFSRVVVFLRCSINNRACTVLDAFLNSIEQFRCPLKIRSDYGTENVAVARWMLEHHGTDKKPFITIRELSGCGLMSKLTLHPILFVCSETWKKKVY